MVQRDQRRRTGRIDRQARPAQVEDIRNPVGEDAQRSPGHRSTNRCSPDRRDEDRGSRSTIRRYRRRSPSPRACLPESRHLRSRAIPARAGCAAAGPSAPPRAARSRKTPVRTDRHRGSAPPTMYSSCPARHRSGDNRSGWTTGQRRPRRSRRCRKRAVPRTPPGWERPETGRKPLRSRSIHHSCAATVSMSMPRKTGGLLTPRPAFITHPLRKNQFVAASGGKTAPPRRPAPAFQASTAAQHPATAPACCGEPSGSPT